MAFTQEFRGKFNGLSVGLDRVLKLLQELMLDAHVVVGYGDNNKAVLFILPDFFHGSASVGRLTG